MELLSKISAATLEGINRYGLVAFVTTCCGTVASVAAHAMIVL